MAYEFAVLLLRFENVPKNWERSQSNQCRICDVTK